MDLVQNFKDKIFIKYAPCIKHITAGQFQFTMLPKILKKNEIAEKEKTNHETKNS